MKKALNYPIIFTLLLFLLVGCSSTAKLNGKKSTEKYQERPGVINENFDPMKLDREEIQIQRTKNTATRSDNIDKLLQQSDGGEQATADVVGFRVQICAVSDEQKARAIQQEAILNFIDENIYLKYDAPYYKVRIGDFVTRREAEQLQKLAVARGFNDAWVVRTKIKVNPQKGEPPQQPNQQPPN